MTTTKSQNATPTQALFDQVKALNAEFVKNSRHASKVYLESFERAVDRALEIETRLAGLSQQEWLKEMIEGQGEVTREFASSYTSAVQSLVK